MGMFESHLPCCGVDVESWVASRYLILYCTIGRKNVRVCASGELQPRTGDGPHSTVRRQIARMCVLRYDHADTYARIIENDAALLKYGRVTHGAPDTAHDTPRAARPDATHHPVPPRQTRDERVREHTRHATADAKPETRAWTGLSPPRSAPLRLGSRRPLDSPLSTTVA